MRYPFTWNTIMHFEDLADNGELSSKCSIDNYFRPARNITLHDDYIISKVTRPHPLSICLL